MAGWRLSTVTMSGHAATIRSSESAVPLDAGGAGPSATAIAAAGSCVVAAAPAGCRRFWRDARGRRFRRLARWGVGRGRCAGCGHGQDALGGCGRLRGRCIGWRLGVGRWGCRRGRGGVGRRLGLRTLRKQIRRHDRPRSCRRGIRPASEQGELQLQAQAADPGTIRVDGDEAARHGGQARAAIRGARPGLGDEPGSDGVDHLVQQRPRVAAPLLESIEDPDTCRRVRRSAGPRRSHRRPLRRPARADRGRRIR